MCKNNIDIAKSIKIGDELQISNTYFEDAFDVFFEIGFKLAHVLWRAVDPSNRAEADGHLIDVTFDLINDGRYKLAISVLELFLFGGNKKFSNERSRLVCIVNLAQAHKWSGSNGECEKILDAQDWSAATKEFDLVVAVLKDDFGSASRLLRELGLRSSFGEKEYRRWPLFRKFRRSREFLEAFKEVFEAEFAPVDLDKLAEISSEANIEMEVFAKRIDRDGEKVTEKSSNTKLDDTSKG